MEENKPADAVLTTEGVQPVEETKLPEQNEHGLDEFELAAQQFHRYHSIFHQIAVPLSNRKKRALIRVLEYVLFHPLETVELFGEEEKNLVELCNHIMYNKGKVIEYATNQVLKNKETEKQNGA